MIRFVDLRHVAMGARFAFGDTVTDQFLSLDGCQAFDDLAELTDYHSTSNCGFPLSRLVGLMPEWANVIDTEHDADRYEVVRAPQ